jgi:hypothetical protein
LQNQNENYRLPFSKKIRPNNQPVAAFMLPNTEETTKKRNLPNLIIIGGQKCATTSLHYYLGLHPEIFMSRQKELNFFVREYNWDKGVEWYKSHFIGKVKIFGESSPDYTHYPFFDGVPERIHALLQQPKLIYILRNPIDRIVSEYVHRRVDGKENRTIEDALAHLDGNPYVSRSKYFMQLEQYLEFFDKSSIKIVILEDLYAHPQKTLGEIFNFLEVDDTFYSRKFLLKWHKSKFKRRKNRFGIYLSGTSVMKFVELLPFALRGPVEKILFFPLSYKVRRPVLNQTLQRNLVEFLKDDIRNLTKYTGRQYKGWLHFS